MHIAIRWNNPILWLSAGTLVVAFGEWLLFELWRTPYRPPWDMMPQLGEGKYTVFALMIGIAILWLGFVIAILVRCKLTIQNYFALTAMMAVTTAIFVYIINNPGRTVVPWELLWS